MQKNLDQAVNKGLIHKNQAARKKSRLSTQIKALWLPSLYSSSVFTRL